VNLTKEKGDLEKKKMAGAGKTKIIKEIEIGKYMDSSLKRKRNESGSGPKQGRSLSAQNFCIRPQEKNRGKGGKRPCAAGHRGGSSE